MAKKVLTKLCGVCGAQAIGYYNFNAITCDSCKAFFRRNASKREQMKCYFDGNCQINFINRKTCKLCRLNQCFTIGMKKEWILSEEEKIWRRYKKNKIRTQNVIKDKNHRTYALAQPLTLNDSSVTSVTNSLCKTSKSIEKSYNEMNSKTIGNNNSILLDSYSIESYNTVIPISKPITDYKNNFTESESNKLTELLSATYDMISFRSIRMSDINKNPIIEEACSVWAMKCDQEIRKIVEMSKHLSGFSDICDNDRIALVKYGSVEIYIMRLIMKFNFEQQFWVLANVNYKSVLLTLDLLKEFRKNLFDAYENFVKKMGAEWDSDPIIIDLLTAVVLFDPDRPNLLNRQLIELQKHIYMHLLQRYLLLRYRSEFEAKEKFQRLMNSLKELRDVKEAHKMNYSKKDPDHVLPLLREVFDVSTYVNGYNSPNFC